MQKIIIIGFPHSGTTILKAIISHIRDVYEIINESKYITDDIINDVKNIDPDKKYIVCKYPFIDDSFFSSEYDDYIIIFIIRNPIHVFSSLNKRFRYGELDNNHSIDKYLYVAEKFLYYQKNNKHNIFTIKYEDMFINNYINLKNIFNKIGFDYNNTIFNNTLYKNNMHDIDTNYINIPKNKPSDTSHILYRYYQINQPFVNNNYKTPVTILNSQSEILKNNIIVREIYPIII